jgi:hypothetical protein
MEVRALTSSFHYIRGVRLGTALAAIALALTAAEPASAAEVSLSLESEAGVRLGVATELGGRVTEAGAPLPDREVELELRRHPYKGAWRATGITDMTDAEGRYSFARELDRNHQVRVRLAGVPPSGDVFSPPREAYVLPAFTHSFDQRGGRRVRLRQVYTVPRDVKLTAPTRFYVGPCKPGKNGKCKVRFAPFRIAAETRRLRAGRFEARATIRLPRSYDGDFQAVSCFRYSPGSGMGDPDQRCPKRWMRVPQAQNP